LLNSLGGCSVPRSRLVRSPSPRRVRRDLVHPSRRLVEDASPRGRPTWPVLIGRPDGAVWALSPIVHTGSGDDDGGMNTADSLHDRAFELVEAARAFHAAAEQPTSHAAAPDSLASLEEALQMLSAAWYQLAADASPGAVSRRHGRDPQAGSQPQPDGLSREQEVRLLGTLHDVAAAFARCAGACREGRTTVTPIIARRMVSGRTEGRAPGEELSWFEGRGLPTRRVA
jgi:hypothetical protein